MRAVIKAGPGAGNIAVLDADIPSPGPGEALIRIGASGLCGTDLLVYDGVYRGRNNPVPPSLILGHEASGYVIELGPGTTWPPPGTRVGIEAVWGCTRCYHCVRGNYNLCQDWHHIGLTRAGALAEYVVLPATSLLPLPDSMTLDSAAMLEPLATAVHTMERVRVTPGTSAAVIGPGPLGFLHMQLLLAAGAFPVVMYGHPGDEARLNLASALGARVFVGDRQAIAEHARDATDGIGFGITIEAGGTATAVQSALDIVSGNGTMVTLGLVRHTELDALQVMRKNLTWIGVVSSVRRHFAAAIRLIDAGTITPVDLITHRLPLDAALAGFDALRQRAAVKVMFDLTASIVNHQS
jgi:2-desacetyl-2-hydroxyethyl bacteriochlorophyllide A dehydrogenase